MIDVLEQQLANPETDWNDQQLAENFFAQVQEQNRSNSYESNRIQSLPELRQSFFQLAGQQLEQLRQTDFLDLRKKYPSQGNVINYVAGLLEIYTNHYGDFAEREIGLIDDWHTGIIEHALADATGEFVFNNQWVRDNGRLRLKTFNKFLDEIIDRSIDDSTGQIPAFEIERNKMDKRIVDILTNVRNWGSKAKVVKFSPSPVNIQDPEVRKRGYQGNDQICIFELTADGQEQQTIKWFRRASRDQYLQLASDLIAADPNYHASTSLKALLKKPASEQLDLEVMAFSNSFTSRQMKVLDNFISQNQAQLAIDRPAIEKYARTVMREVAETELASSVYRAANGLLNGEVDITPRLEEIFGLIEQYQLEFRLYNRDYGGIDTFNKQTSAKLLNYSWEDYQQMSIADRFFIVKASQFEAGGCGFNAEIAKLISATVLYGPMPINLNYFTRDRDVYECPGCHKEHDIRLKLIDFCDRCGKDAKCA